MLALRHFSLELGGPDQDMMRLLDKKGADFYSLSDMNFSIIHTAIEHNSIHSLAYFKYEKFLDFEIKNAFEMTPYLYAVNQEWAARLSNPRQMEAFRFLSSLDLNFEATDSKKNSALHLATKNGNTKMIYKILLKGLNPFQRNKRNETPYLIAKDNEYNNILALFVAGFCPLIRRKQRTL